MIPIYLEMKAFGPYAGQEIVDFRELGDHKLFLIYGPTGSGTVSYTHLTLPTIRLV